MSSIYRRGKIYWYSFYKDGQKMPPFSLETTDKQQAELLQKQHDIALATNRNYLSKFPSQQAIDIYHSEVARRCTAKHSNEIKTRLEKLCKEMPFLNDIDRQDISGILAGCKTVYDSNNHLAMYKAFFRWCVRNKYLTTSPTDGLKIAPIQDNARTAWTKAELARITAAAKKERIYPLVMIARYTGMRKSNLFRLDWRDVDIKKRVIRLLKTKSKKFHIIPLAKDLKAILAPIAKNEGPICDVHNHRRIIDRILRNAKVTGGWHNFRHSFCTHLLQDGVDIKTVSALAGHSSIAVTAKYLTTTPQHMTDAVDRL